MRYLLDNTRESVSDTNLENSRYSQLQLCFVRLINPGIDIALRAGGFLSSLISPEILCFSLVVQIIIVHATQSRRSLYKDRDHEQSRKNAGKSLF